LSDRLNGKPVTEPNFFEFEKRWTEQRNDDPATPSGGPVATAAKRPSRAYGPYSSSRCLSRLAGLAKHAVSLEPQFLMVSVELRRLVSIY
jgi:hypothetical protein